MSVLCSRLYELHTQYRQDTCKLEKTPTFAHVRGWLVGNLKIEGDHEAMQSLIPCSCIIPSSGSCKIGMAGGKYQRRWKFSYIEWNLATRDSHMELMLYRDLKRKRKRKDEREITLGKIKVGIVDIHGLDMEELVNGGPVGSSHRKPRRR